MPQDAVFGRDLAQQLTNEYLGLIGEVIWTYDAEIDVEDLPSERPFCVVSPLTYERKRLTRAHWQSSIQIVVSLVSHVGSTSEQEWVDSWLDSWDTLVDLVREMKVLKRHKPLDIDQEDRYDAGVFHNHQRLFTQASLHYGNVEVP